MKLSDIEKLRNNLDKGKYEPFIRYIRFPFYKNLEKNAELEFDFPITAIVGQNGTNKSSVVRAVFGCPYRYSTGTYWFSTELDPILDLDGRPRFIYGYKHPKTGQMLEVIKQRTHSKKYGPDYWEPAPPKMADGMEKMPEWCEIDSPHRSTTRWNTIKKAVLIIDFRSELSAFDKYFYFGTNHNSHAYKDQKEVLRLHTSKLKKALRNGGSWYSCKVSVVQDINLEGRRWVNYILGKSFTEIKWIEHNFFGKQNGITVILKSEELQYTEAFAGSGEFAVVSMVEKILKQDKKSLIILDEPEVSLYPEAQERVVDFLIHVSKRYHHQILLSTHSPFMCSKLPPDALKTLVSNPTNNKISIVNKNNSNDVFHQLGVEGKKFKVFVEDRLSVAVVNKALLNLSKANRKLIDVRFISGGSDMLLKKYLPAYAVALCVKLALYQSDLR